MPNNTVNSYFQPSLERDRLSKQTKSHNHSGSENIQIHTPQILRPREPSSVRLPHGTSFNMFSIISKFEGLDAVSLPMKVPSLQPAHLHISRNSSRRNTGTEGTQIKRLSTIFSPRNKSSDVADEVDHIDKVTSGPEGTFNTQDIGGGPSAKKPERGKLRKSQYPIKPGTSTTHAKSKDLPPQYQDRDSSDTIMVTQDTLGGRLKRRKTIKDIIRFYDGAVSTGNNTKAKPSLVQTPTPRTPPRERRSHDNCESCGGRSNSVHNGYTRNPIKPAHTTSAKKRNLLFGPTVPNPFLTRSLPSKLATSRASYNERQNIENKVQSSPRRSKFGLLQDITPDRTNAGSVESTPTRVPRGRSRGPKPVTRNARHISESRRNISDKIEALYCAKSIERRRENTQVAEVVAQPANHINSQMKRDRERPTKPDNDRRPTDRSSKVAEMKRIFDERTQPKNHSSIAPMERPKTPAKNFSLPLNAEKSVFDTAPASPPPPPPLPDFSSKRTSGVSPKTIVEPTPIVERENPVHVPPAKLPQDDPSLTERHPRAKSKAIEDRLKLFDGCGPQKQGVKTEKKERSFSGLVGSSITSMRRSFFERAAWRKPEVDIHEKKRALTGKEVQSIVDEFQDGAVDGKIGKSKTIVGRWNVVPQRLARSSVTRVTDENERRVSSFEGSESEMVVKEARCGLKQPKPMRATEMKRMVMLCREKVGTTMGKEKGKTGVSEKL